MKRLPLLALGALVFVGFTGCQDYMPDESLPSYEESGLPSFSMTQDLTFDVDLGLPGVNYPVSVYAENPFTDEGELRSDVKPIFAFFTTDGKYNETVNLANRYDKLYLACGGVGAPGLMVANVENGVIAANNAVATRAAIVETTNSVNETVQNELNLGGYEILPVNVQSKFKRFGDLTHASADGTAFWSNLHTLYTWTATGKPFRKGSVDTYQTTIATEVDASASYDKCEFYFNNETGEVKENTFGWITYEGNTTPMVRTRTVEVEVDDTENPLYSYFNLTANDKENYFKLNIQALGTLTITRRTNNSSDVKFYTKWASSADWDTKLGLSLKNQTEASHQFTSTNASLTDGKYLCSSAEKDGYYIACRQGSPADVTTITYQQNAIVSGEETIQEATVYKLVLNNDGTVTCTKQVGEAEAEADDSFFLNIPESKIVTVYGKKTVQQQEPIPATNAPSSVGNLNYGLPMKTTTAGVATNTTIHFYVPKNTQAKLTIVYGDTDKAHVKVHNMTTNVTKSGEKDDVVGIRTYTLDGGQYQITQSQTTYIYYMCLENEKIFNTVTTKSTYRAHKNVLDANMQQLLNDLTSELWSGYGSKTARKEHFRTIAKNITDGKTGSDIGYDETNDKFGGEYLAEKTYNMRYSQLEQGKKNNVTVTKDGTEVWVTFLAEYNMYSCNTMGYYYYTQAEYDAAKAAGKTPEQFVQSLPKYIIFPNCSSNQYNTRTAGKYFQNKQLFDENVVPLHTGDRVQLVYKGSGSANAVLSGQGYTEQFPAGTIIGWFLLYNGFDGWDDKTDMITDGILRYADDGTVYNNNPDKSDQSIYKSRVYYSDKEFNKGYTASAAPTRAAAEAGNTEIERVVQISEPGGIAICFEDSYSATKGYDDMTYDDLIIAVTASEPLENNSGNTSTTTSTTTTFNEYGTYLFEDILDGNVTDFDMNDVVVEYDRTYTITYGDKAAEKYPVTLSKVVETYTVKNDGATYDDAFVIKTPYRYADIQSLNYTYKTSAAAAEQSGSWTPAATSLFVQDKEIASVGTLAPKFETDGEFLEIVLFDNINYVNIGSVFTFTIEFKSALDAGSSTTGVSWDARKYLHSSYDPYVIVIVDKDNNTATGEGERNEMHTPGKQPSSHGKTVVTNAAMASLTNNYWSVAKVGSDYYPFALDLASVKDFKVCTEYTIFSKGYPNFLDWSKNNNNYKDWYNYSNEGYLSPTIPTQR